MTLPDTEDEATEPRVLTVTLAGHEFQIKELTELQVMLLARCARLLSKDNVGWDAKSEAMDRMFNILHSRLVNQEQLSFLEGLEEQGDVSLRDLQEFVKAFNVQDKPAEPVVRRRGRPRKSLS
jgi:hypothetical protein